jgi:hypothetical protein
MNMETGMLLLRSEWKVQGQTQVKYLIGRRLYRKFTNVWILKIATDLHSNYTFIYGRMAYIIWNYDNLSTKWCIKRLPLLNLNNATDLFPRVSYQLSSSSWSPGNRPFLHAGVRRVEKTWKSRRPRFFTNERLRTL